MEFSCSNYLGIFFFRIDFISINGGMVSPNKSPQGFKGSMWSKMSFTMPVRGIHKIMPGMPHKAPNETTPMMVTRAFILTFDATNIGTM